MKCLTRFFSTSLLVLSSIGASTVEAIPMEVIFDNTINASGAIFGPGCCHVGNEVTLEGTARKVIQLSWRVDSQNNDVVADFETQIYANDGLGGAPSTLLWDSGPLIGIDVSATDTFLDVVVPKIVVPDVITVTSRILASTPVALGRVGGEPPTIGSVNTSWIERSPGVWGQAFGPWALRISAVPEPPTISMLIIGGVLLLLFSSCRAALPLASSQST